MKLTFPRVLPSPALEVMRVEEARAVLMAFDAGFPLAQGHRFQSVLAAVGQGAPAEGTHAEWQQRLREEYLSRYGPPLLPLPQSLEESRLFQALRMSPSYMGAGIRDAAEELFSSPAFLASVSLSVLVYFAAWMMPEPLFSKAFAAALTVRLALAVGVLELGNLALVCLRLYREAEAARTLSELEVAAERFGRAMGGTALRVLVLVASAGVAKTLPKVPEGGLSTLLGPPRYAVPGGLIMEARGIAQVAADGSLVVAGAAVGTAAATLGSACRDGAKKEDGHYWHHIATNKNETSSANGGPWTPLFRKLFKKAGMDLDAPENLVYLAGHQGPHPEEYHVEVFRRLETAVAGCRTIEQCRRNLVDEIRRLANEICTPGSRLNRVVTRASD